MRDIRQTKGVRITEYSLLFCILIVKIWCGFLNQALLFAAGGVINVLVDFALCVYLVLNAKRRRCVSAVERTGNDLLTMWVVFAFLYIAIFSLAWNDLIQYSFLGMFELPKQVYDMLFSIIYFCPLILAVKNMDENERKLTSNVLLAVFFSVALANLITAIVNPELVKNEAYNEGTSLFTLGYGGSYNLMLMTPIFLYKLRASKYKFLFAAVVICNLASVFYGGYFIAILGTLVVLLMYAILSMKNKFVVLLLGVLLVGSVIALIVSGVLEDWMWYLAENVEIEVIRDRCDDIARYLSGDTDVGKGDTTFRLFIYQDTFNNFLKHPILGNFVFGNYACQWDHSTVLDILAVGGIFLCGLFFAVIVYGYKFACSFMKDDRARRALLAAVVAYVFVASINPVLSHKQLGILFVVAPIIMGGEAQGDKKE